MKTKLSHAALLVCVPVVAAQGQTRIERIDDQIKPLVNSFKGKVSLFAKNLDTRRNCQQS